MPLSAPAERGRNRVEGLPGEGAFGCSREASETRSKPVSFVFPEEELVFGRVAQRVGFWQGGFTRGFWVIPGSYDAAHQARDGEEALARCEWLCHACCSRDEARLRERTGRVL